MKAVPTYNLFIDTTDSCNLRCTTCSRGIGFMKNSKNSMDYSLFKRIIDKAINYNITHISLFNWAEPFLNLLIYKYALYIKESNLKCMLSSNLSFQPEKTDHIIKTLRICDNLIVSVSGFTQKTYEINHKNGNIDFVKKNLLRISEEKAKGLIKGNIEIRYFIFDYTKNEYPLFEEFAKSLQLKIIPLQAFGNPKAEIPLSRAEDTWPFYLFHPQMGNIVARDLNYRLGKICQGACSNIPIDYQGNVYQCCHVPNFPYTCVGSFVEDDFDLIQYRRATHGLCTMCTWFTWDKIPGSVAASIERGLKKYLSHTDEELESATFLSGKQVYYYGMGEMFFRKRGIFDKCKPIYILSDFVEKGRYDLMHYGIPVRHPDDVLPYSKDIPIVIFAGRESREIIRNNIQNKYSHMTQIFSCIDAY